MEDGETAEFGRGRKVDPHRPIPRGKPVVMTLVDRRGLEDAGVVDQHIDMAAEPLQRLRPKRFGRARMGAVVGDSAVLAAAGRAQDIELDRKSARLTSSRYCANRMPSSYCETK